MMKNFRNQFVYLFAFLLFSTNVARAQTNALSIDVQNVNLEQFFLTSTVFFHKYVNINDVKNGLSTTFTHLRST